MAPLKQDIGPRTLVVISLAIAGTILCQGLLCPAVITGPSQYLYAGHGGIMVIREIRQVIVISCGGLGVFAGPAVPLSPAEQGIVVTGSYLQQPLNTGLRGCPVVGPVGLLQAGMQVLQVARFQLRCPQALFNRICWPVCHGIGL